MSNQEMAFNGADAAPFETENAKASITEAANDVQSDAQNIGGSITRDTADIAGKVNAKLEEVAIDAEPMIKAAREKTSELGIALIDEIKRRPLQSLLVGAMAGLVVGVLTSR